MSGIDDIVKLLQAGKVRISLISTARQGREEVLGNDSVMIYLCWYLATLLGWHSIIRE